MFIVIILLIIIGILDIFCDILFKKWSIKKFKIDSKLIAGILLYNLIAIIYAITLRYSLLSVVSSLWTGTGLILTFLIGYFYFKERPNKKQLFFILLIFLGSIGLTLSS